MKQLLITVKPQYAINILNGTKTLELRTYIPKDFAGWVNIVVGKGKPYLMRFEHNHDYVIASTVGNGLTYEQRKHFIQNGKVVCRFWFDEYETLKHIQWVNQGEETYTVNGELKSNNEILKKLCLEIEDVCRYGKGKDLYAWHIKKLEIFDMPKELEDFYKVLSEREEVLLWNLDLPLRKIVTKAPQKYMYVWRDAK